MTRAEVRALYAKDKAGERVTAQEWADIAVYHADVSARLSKVSVSLALVAVALTVLSLLI